MTIETARLLLRSWRDSDIERWVAMNADLRVMEFFPRPYDRPTSEKFAALARVELERDGFGWWVVEEKGGSPFVGVVWMGRGRRDDIDVQRSVTTSDGAPRHDT